MANAKLDVIFSQKDNVEIVRDQIARILKLECDKQYEMAEQAGLLDRRDYKFLVTLENDNPLSVQTEDDDVFPLVNVTLQSVSGVENSGGSTSTDKRNRVAKFFVDCFSCSNFENEQKGTSIAMLKAWKSARIVRNILEAACYTYLGLRGVVTKREITSFESFAKQKDEAGAMVEIVRISLNVYFEEKSEQVQGVELEPINTKIVDENGVVVVG